MPDDRFEHQTYLVRKKVFTLLGSKFHIYDENGELVLFSAQKAFKLREDIRLYTGEDMQTELLVIKARNIIDFSAAYDVVDASTGEKIGAYRRRGLRSILRDKWEILDANDLPVGEIEEDSMALAMLRRFLIDLIPQTFTATLGGRTVCEYRRKFNPFILKAEVDFSSDPGRTFDRRLGLAGAVLLSAVEGRQGD